MDHLAPKAVFFALFYVFTQLFISLFPQFVNIYVCLSAADSIIHISDI